MGALTLEEVHCLVGNEIAREVLRRVHTAHNQGTVAISTLPQLNQIGLLDSLLKLDRTTHHRDLILRIVDCTPAAKTSDSLLCFSEATLAYKPPRRFGSNKEEDGEWSREHPLKRNWNSVVRISMEI